MYKKKIRVGRYTFCTLTVLVTEISSILMKEILYVPLIVRIIRYT